MTLPAGTKAKVGGSCPESGGWHPVGNPLELRSIGIHDKMPMTPKGETHWVLKAATGGR
jgi:hypothetical protein